MGTPFNAAYCGATHQYAGIAAKYLTRVKIEAHCYEDYLDFMLKHYTQTVLDRHACTNITIASNVDLWYWSVDRSIGICLYSTIILIYYADNTFDANDGGFRTPTTKSRISQFGPKAYHFYYSDNQLRGSDWRTGIGGPMGREILYPVFPSLPIKRFGQRTRRVRKLA